MCLAKNKVFSKVYTHPLHGEARNSIKSQPREFVISHIGKLPVIGPNEHSYRARSYRGPVRATVPGPGTNPRTGPRYGRLYGAASGRAVVSGGIWVRTVRTPQRQDTVRLPLGAFNFFTTGTNSGYSFK